jgi:tRNA (guanine26-N2/guanine27-N2)-dimethyltransferase
MGEEVSVAEGKATLYFASKKGVFYNPAQIPNRDLSVLALQEFAEMWASEPTKRKPERGRSLRNGPAVSESDAPVSAADEAAAPGASSVRAASGSGDAQPEDGPSAGPVAAPRLGLRVVDALSASGLRAMRYSLEVPGLREVVANDVDPVAVATLRSNLQRNGLSAPAVVSHVADATALLHASRPPLGHRFDVVDLDPYGTAAPFLDSAVQVRFGASRFHPALPPPTSDSPPYRYHQLSGQPINARKPPPPCLHLNHP